jgi:hypothetical protein
MIGGTFNLWRPLTISGSWLAMLDPPRLCRSRSLALPWREANTDLLGGAAPPIREEIVHARLEFSSTS